MKRLRNLHRNLRRIPLGLAMGILAALYVAFYLVQTVQHNYQLQQQIAAMQGQIANLQATNQTLQYQIQYYNTDDYKEKEARAKLGLQDPGEKVVLLPHAAGDSQQVPSFGSAPVQQSPKGSNWQQWLEFLQGKIR